MKAKIQITRAELVPDKRGQFIKITMVKLMDEHGKYIKFAKLNDALLNKLQDAIIDINIGHEFEPE